MYKVLMTASVASHFLAFHLPCIDMLNSMGCTVDIASKITDASRPILSANQQFNILFERSPYKFSNIQAYKQLKLIITDNKYNIIHCHTPMASFLTRLAARKSRKHHGTRVIYTAHGFHFFKGASLLNWLLYYPIERWMARYTDVLTTINKEDYARAKRFKAGRVEYVPGVGIDIDIISRVSVGRKQKRKELGIPIDATVLLSVGELNRNKNHEVVLKALSKIHNSNIHYVVCGQGRLEPFLKELSAKLHIEKQVHILGLRRDVIEICKMSDIFVFPSKREGLSVSLMEAMVCRLPVVCSRTRGNTDLIEDGKGGYLCNLEKATEFSQAICTLIGDLELRRCMGEHNHKAILQFSLNNVMSDMRKIYESVGL